jgi:hypothetical protein
MPDIPTLLATVEWQATTHAPEAGCDLPYATHRGVFEIMGFKMRCYRLNTGEAIFDAEDVEAFFSPHIPDGDPEAKEGQ